jgi:ribosomal protein S18 acetylase RimI-like enzyme
LDRLIHFPEATLRPAKEKELILFAVVLGLGINKNLTSQAVQRERRLHYRIEPMAASDFDEVLRLWQKMEGIGLNESDTRPALTQYLARNPGLSFVARNGTEIVGAVLCGHDGRRGYLHHLAVARGHRKKGLGKKLVATCLSGLKRLGILKCNIFLFADNTGGERFWKRNGWVMRPDLRLMQKAVLPSKAKRCC